MAPRVRAASLGVVTAGLARPARPWANVARVVANPGALAGCGASKGAGQNAQFSLAVRPCLPARRTPAGFDEVPL